MNFAVGQYIWIRDCINKDSSGILKVGMDCWLSDQYILRLMSEQDIENYKIDRAIKKYNI